MAKSSEKALKAKCNILKCLSDEAEKLDHYDLLDLMGSIRNFLDNLIMIDQLFDDNEFVSNRIKDILKDVEKRISDGDYNV